MSKVRALIDVVPVYKFNRTVEPLDYASSTIEDMENHASTMSMGNLQLAAQKRSTIVPVLEERVVQVFRRDPYIREYAKRMADGICQLCNQPSPFENLRGEPFLETHHIVPLAEGGGDSIDNIVALCPNCHRKMHILKSKEDMEKLFVLVRKY